MLYFFVIIPYNCDKKKKRYGKIKNLTDLQKGENFTFADSISLIARLSIPAILAQISTIVMEYIDASMVGRLGEGASAAIGLMSSSTWLLGGLCMAVSTGFTVMIAHLVGAGDERHARNVVRQGLLCALIFSLLLTAFAAPLSFVLPGFLGGKASIKEDATAYFFIYALSLPVVQINNIAAGMIQCSGNMKLPSFLHVAMCVLDVVFNVFFIYVLKMGVRGAALGTAAAELVIMCIMLLYLLKISPPLHIRRDEKFEFIKADLTYALKVMIPVACEQIIMCSAYIMSTKIVAPLGNTAIAAHSFSITAESLCYMPGYGIGAAATTLVGQSIGAGRKELTRKFGWMATLLGMAVMTASGVLLYIFAPQMIGILTPNEGIRKLGTTVLRIEAFAEPFYGASIVANGVFRGTGKTKIPSIMNLVSMWVIRIPASAILATRLGLRGVWIAMCTELCCRGMMFLARLMGKKWSETV